MFLHQIQNINIQLTQRVDISNRDVEIDTTIDVESLLTYDTLTPDDSLKDKNIQSGKPAKDCINTEKRMLFDSASENNYMETSVEIKTYIEKTCDQKILDRCTAKLSILFYLPYILRKNTNGKTMDGVNNNKEVNKKIEQN